MHEENRATRDGADMHFVYTVIPEFLVALILPLFMIAALIAVNLGCMHGCQKMDEAIMEKPLSQKSGIKNENV